MRWKPIKHHSGWGSLFLGCTEVAGCQPCPPLPLAQTPTSFPPFMQLARFKIRESLEAGSRLGLISQCESLHVSACAHTYVYLEEVVKMAPEPSRPVSRMWEDPEP